MKFLTSKFDELERERKEKGELINNLQIEVSSLRVEIKILEKKADGQDQYLLRNCLLIHGLMEAKTEDTDEMVLDVINNKLNIEMSQRRNDRSHHETLFVTCFFDLSNICSTCAAYLKFYIFYLLC